MKNHAKSIVLGIDLGGTKILSAIVDDQGAMLARDHSVTPRAGGRAAVVQTIMVSVEKCFEQIKMDASCISGIGIGVPGPSNPDTGMLFMSPNLPGWEDVQVTEIIRKEYQKEVFLINDANAGALGELYYGAAKAMRHFIYLTISTGIGGGIVIDGNLYTGAIGTAAELGHMTIDLEGPLCNCGNYGCWETMASGTALTKEAKKRLQTDVQTSIRDSVGNDMEKVTAEIIHAEAEKGDSLANELIARTGFYLGVGLANLINIFNPEMIVTGGGLANIGKRLFDPALAEARKRSYTVSFDAVRFVPAALGRNSGVLGAAAFAFSKLKGSAAAVA